MTNTIEHQPRTVIEGIDAGKRALELARDDLERLAVRDQAKAAMLAAEVLKRKDIQSKASVLVVLAERAIHEANPPAQGHRTDIMPRGHEVNGDLKRKIRQAHKLIDNTEFKKLIDNAEATGSVVTRQTIREHGTEQRKLKARATRDRNARTANQGERIRLAATDAPPAVIHHASCAQMTHKLRAGSVDAIITDPPYPREYIDVWSHLGELAARVLAPGGALAALSGYAFLPDVLDRLRGHDGLTYETMDCWRCGAGGVNMVWLVNRTQRWKPIIIMRREPYDKMMTMSDTIVSPTSDKHLHPWQQSVEGTRQMVERYSPPGGIVLDPFAGSGTTGVACAELGRRFIGADIEAETVETARQRIPHAELAA